MGCVQSLATKNGQRNEAELIISKNSIHEQEKNDEIEHLNQNPQETEEKKKILLKYWNIQGLGAPSRMLLTYFDIPFDDEFIDPKEWYGPQKLAWRKKDPLINLPHIIDGDVVVTQCHVVLSYLGRKYGICEMKDSMATSTLRCEQVQIEILEHFWSYVRIIYPHFTKKEDFPEQAETYLTRRGRGSVHDSFLKLEACLSNWKTKFFSCDNLNTCDFLVFQVLRAHKALALHCNLDEKFFKDFPKLKKFMQTMRQLKKLESYFKTGNGTILLNPPFAHFNIQDAQF